MPVHKLKKQSAGTIDNPPLGYMSLFADLDSVVKSKNDDGVVRPITDQATSSLATDSPGVVEVDGGPPPSPGDILRASSPTAAGWVDPDTLPFFLNMANTAVKTDADSPYLASAGECVLVDLYDGDAGATDVEIDLPSAAANLNKEIWIKIVSIVTTTAGVLKVVVDATAPDTIGGADPYDMVSDYEWIKLRAMDIGGGNFMWGQIG